MRRTRTARSRLAGLAAVLLLGGSAVACGSDGDGSSSTTEPVRSQPSGSEGEPVGGGAPGFYVSIGDSYAQGYQPAADDGISDFTRGYAYQLPKLALAKGYDLELVNFGCGGATVGSVLEAEGCAPSARSPFGPDYTGSSQLDAAVAFLEVNRGQVDLVTIAIGGNDVTACARGADDPIACVGDAVETIDDGLETIVTRVREAAGPDTVIVGITYPDVILGAYLDEATRPLGELSVVAFRELINPMLKRIYESVDGIFVDVTEATDAYVPLDQTTELAPYGEIPVAVAEVCELTWFCERTDIHPTDEGYEVIAGLIADALPER